MGFLDRWPAQKRPGVGSPGLPLILNSNRHQYPRFGFEPFFDLTHPTNRTSITRNRWSFPQDTTQDSLSREQGRGLRVSRFLERPQLRANEKSRAGMAESGAA